MIVELDLFALFLNNSTNFSYFFSISSFSMQYRHVWLAIRDPQLIYDSIFEYCKYIRIFYVISNNKQSSIISSSKQYTNIHQHLPKGLHFNFQSVASSSSSYKNYPITTMESPRRKYTPSFYLRTAASQLQILYSHSLIIQFIAWSRPRRMPTKTRPSFVIIFICFSMIFYSGCCCYFWTSGAAVVILYIFPYKIVIFGTIIVLLLRIVDQMTETTTYRIPKIKRSQVLLKLLLDPSQLKKGLPESTLPQLTDKSLIISLSPQKVPLAKLSPEGSLKMLIKYNAQTIELIDKYIEVTVIDDYEDFWVGTLFGFTVRGTGGHGTVRGCKVTGIQGQTILAQYLIEGENESWKKFQAKIQDILSKNK